MKTGPQRDAKGDFLPPQYRLESVPASSILAGQTILWAFGGRSQPCKVAWVDPEPLPMTRLLFMKLRPRDRRPTYVSIHPDTTVNRVEILRA